MIIPGSNNNSNNNSSHNNSHSNSNSGKDHHPVSISTFSSSRSNLSSEEDSHRAGAVSAQGAVSQPSPLLFKPISIESMGVGGGDATISNNENTTTSIIEGKDAKEISENNSHAAPLHTPSSSSSSSSAAAAAVSNNKQTSSPSSPRANQLKEETKIVEQSDPSSREPSTRETSKDEKKEVRGKDKESLKDHKDKEKDAIVSATTANEVIPLSITCVTAVKIIEWIRKIKHDMVTQSCNNNPQNHHNTTNQRSPFTPQDHHHLSGAISPGGGKYPSPIPSNQTPSHPIDSFSPQIGDLQQLPQSQPPPQPPSHPYDNGLEDEELSSLISTNSGGILGDEGSRRGGSGSRSVTGGGGGRTPSPSLSSYNTPATYTTPYTTPYTPLHPHTTYQTKLGSSGWKPGGSSGGSGSSGSDVGKTVVIFGRDYRLFPEGVTRRVTIISDKTNKAGGIVAVTGNDGAFAAINIDGYVFTWGAPNCGRLGRGPAAELDDFRCRASVAVVIRLTLYVCHSNNIIPFPTHFLPSSQFYRISPLT